MRPVQRIKIVVVREAGRRPTGGRSVARRTIRRQAKGHVVRIRGLVEIGRMTSCTLCRRTCITRSVTIHTIGGKVRSRQGKTRRIVVKNNVRSTSGVTSQTSRTVVRIAVYTAVIVVCLWVCVASCTRIFRVVRWIGMAIRTGAPFAIVFSAVYGKILGIMVKCRRYPSCFRVTRSAIIRKLQRRVVGTGGLVVICRVATVASIGCRRVIAIVAHRAII